MEKYLVLIVLVIVFLAGCTQQMPEEGMQDETAAGESSEEGQIAETSRYIDITPEEAQTLIAETPELVIIDVSPHYAKGHLPGAVSYYLGDSSLDNAIPSLDPEGAYLVYCHVDSVAILGAQKLIDAGFKNVYRLEGNYAGWVAAGYPVET